MALCAVPTRRFRTSACNRLGLSPYHDVLAEKEGRGGVIGSHKDWSCLASTSWYTGSPALLGSGVRYEHWLF